mmetsp:Transcript_26835/g.71957  ORF Transcript_26835/g.71957 Transcript_26835/m.71957 type:complete len:151 (+) Transcript_26835:2282-2734(+)
MVVLIPKLRAEGCDQQIRLSECLLGGQMFNLKVTHVPAHGVNRVGEIVNLAGGVVDGAPHLVESLVAGVGARGRLLEQTLGVLTGAHGSFTGRFDVVEAPLHLYDLSGEFVVTGTGSIELHGCFLGSSRHFDELEVKAVGLVTGGNGNLL